MTSILNMNFIASVAERDIDLLVVEELRVNPEFATWLVARTWGPGLFEESVGAWHSVTHGSSGESDIVFVFTTKAGARNAILVENKISAVAQPEQAERYRVRGDSDGWLETGGIFEHASSHRVNILALTSTLVVMTMRSAIRN
jgi:hypothetical protein